MVPFTDIGEYVRLLQKLRRTFEPDSYTLFALLSDLGAPETIARVATIAAGLGVLALAWRRRSLTLAIAAALVLSPIAWRHFFVLLIVPLAHRSPTPRRPLVPAARHVDRRRHVQRRAVADGGRARDRRGDDRRL